MSISLDPHGPALDEGPGRRRARPRTLRAVRAPVTVGVVAAVVVVHLGVTDPYRPGRHLACPILALTGFFCAGCGGQRAVHDLAHGDLVAAWGMNPLVVVAVPVALAAWTAWLRRRWRGTRRRAGGAASAVLPWALLAVAALFAVLRNVPALAPALAP